MLGFLTQRLLLLIPVIWGVVTLVFFLIHWIPGDPIDIILGESAFPSDKEALREQLGLNLPLATQYRDYLLGLLQGDLGISLHSQVPVTTEIWERIPATVELMLGSMVVATLLALPLGVLAAVYHRTWIDQGSMLLSLIGISLPNFWLGPMLILLFSIHLDWLPVNERGGWEHLILPSITLGTALAAILSRMTRSSVLETLHMDYVRTARAKGLSEMRVVWQHAFRNALIPIVTIIGLQVGVLLSGAIITEVIFDWPGLGTLLIEGIQTRNYPLVQGCVLFIALSYVIVNLITDISYALLDPRVRVTPDQS